MKHQKNEKPGKQQSSSSRTPSPHPLTSIPPTRSVEQQVITLQRMIGNQAAIRLIQRNGLPGISSANLSSVIQRAFAIGTRINFSGAGWGTVIDAKDDGRCYIKWDSPNALSYTAMYPTFILDDDPRITQVVAPGQQPGGNQSTTPAPAASAGKQEKEKEKEDSPSTSTPAPARDRFGNNVNKTRFESRLAALINQDPTVKSVVAIASHQIEAHLDELIRGMVKASTERPTLGMARGVAQDIGAEMGTFLYSDTGTFGSIGTSAPMSGPHHQVRKAIAGSYGNIQSMMLAQQAYLFNILFELRSGELTKQYLNMLKPSENARGRRKDPDARKNRGMAPTLGILADVGEGEELAKDVGARNLLAHTRTQDSTLPDENHPVVQTMRQLDMPFVGGLSGSAADLITIAHMVGKLQGEDLRLYVLGVIGYLVGGGMHSIHEVMMVAARAGVPYTPGDYNSIFPDSFRQTMLYNLLAQEFPDILPPPAQTNVRLTTYRRGKNFGEKSEKGEKEG